MDISQKHPYYWTAGYNPAVALGRIKAFAEPDTTENIYDGFEIANGFTAGKGAVINHTPGVPEYLAVFYAVTAIRTGVPSPDLARSAYSLSGFATVLFELGCLLLALHILGFGFAPSLVFGAIGLWESAIHFDSAMPMSENFIPYVVILQIVLFARTITTSSPEERLRISGWTLIFLPLLNLLLGLTLAPAELFLWLCSMPFAIGALRHVELRFRTFRACVLPLGLSAILVVAQLFVTDIPGLWFWNVTVNRQQPIDVFGSLGAIFALHRNAFWGLARIPGAVIVDVMLMAGVYLAVVWRVGRKEVSRQLVFLVICLGFCVLCGWRAPIGFKSDCGRYGVFWALLFLTLVHLPPIPRCLYRACSVCAVVLSFWGIAQFHLAQVWWQDRRSDETESREPYLEAAKICRFRESQGCRCIQHTIFDTAYFITHDVQRCVDRYSLFIPMIFHDPTVKQNLLDDLDDTKMAFVVVPEEMLFIDRPLPPKLVAHWFGPGANCIPAGAARICFAPGPI